METEVKKHPDFPQWIKSKEGEDCLLWPISEPKYLQNRLFWAFDAGRNCVWHQYITQKDELASLREQLKQKEKVIRELIPIAEVGQAYYRQNPGFNWAAEREKSKAIIKQEQIYELVKRKDILFLEVKQVNQDLLKALEMLLDHVTEDTMNTNWSDVIKLTKDAIAKSKNIKSYDF